MYDDFGPQTRVLDMNMLRQVEEILLSPNAFVYWSKSERHVYVVEHRLEKGGDGGSTCSFCIVLSEFFSVLAFGDLGDDIYLCISEDGSILSGDLAYETIDEDPGDLLTVLFTLFLPL